MYEWQSPTWIRRLQGDQLREDTEKIFVVLKKTGRKIRLRPDTEHEKLQQEIIKDNLLEALEDILEKGEYDSSNPLLKVVAVFREMTIRGWVNPQDLELLRNGIRDLYDAAKAGKEHEKVRFLLTLIKDNLDLERISLFRAMVSGGGHYCSHEKGRYYFPGISLFLQKEEGVEPSTSTRNFKRIVCAYGKMIESAAPGLSEEILKCQVKVMRHFAEADISAFVERLTKAKDNEVMCIKDNIICIKEAISVCDDILS
jgi:hypothetical protein